MTNTTMNTTGNALTPEQRHVEILRKHGAQILGPDGSHTELNLSFVENAISECVRSGCNAITYDLYLPDIDEPMMIAIWRNGHVDSGSVRNVCNCLESR